MMSAYTPPLKDMAFVLKHVVGMESLPQVREGALDMDMAEVILVEAGKLAADALAPLNGSGDREGCKLADGRVSTPKGFKEAYAKFRDNGWNAVPFDPEWGGQGLPWVLTLALQELWQAANMAFGLCPLLTQAAVEALHAYGAEDQKRTYLSKLVSGEWTGSMQLTEPQAGTDLGAIRCRADKQPDGTYKLSGQKIFITYGEHDFAENIIHMVLARTPDAPAGSRGISMFLVPKFLPDAQGNFSIRNDAYCVGLEHKLGLHASPTCTMQYGDHGGAIGYLVGAENEGLKAMFVMMNNARLGVGVQGVAIAERAYQRALSYARERVQGTRIDAKDGGNVKIIEHPDVRRMLMTMKALTEAGRALALEAGLALDLARAGDAAAGRKVALLTPVVKAWCTDRANDVAALGVQAHGGMGFIEETGAAQYVRDARILTIYEGTNGVQAQDLFVQKVRRDQGQAARDWIAEAQTLLGKTGNNGPLQDLRSRLEHALTGLAEATQWMLSCDLAAGAAVSVPYLRLFGDVAGAVMLFRSAAAAAQGCGGDAAFNAEKILTARFYTTHILPHAAADLETVLQGSEIVETCGERLFG